MTPRLSLVTRAALLGLATVFPLTALAQEAQTDSAQAAQTAAQPDVSMGIPDGMPDAATAQVGQVYLAGTFDLWEHRCVKAAEGKESCQLYQLLTSAEGSPVAEISVFALPEGGQAAAGASILAPLETLLTQNLRIAIEGAQGKLYPFSYCTVNGCLAKVGFTGEEVAAMKSGNAAKITIVPAAAPDKTVEVAVSLKGFTAAFDALKAGL